jgi:hypothetical protein
VVSFPPDPFGLEIAGAFFSVEWFLGLGRVVRA